MYQTSNILYTTCDEGLTRYLTIYRNFPIFPTYLRSWVDCQVRGAEVITIRIFIITMKLLTKQTIYGPDCFHRSLQHSLASLNMSSFKKYATNIPFLFWFITHFILVFYQKIFKGIPLKTKIPLNQKNVRKVLPQVEWFSFQRLKVIWTV